MSILPQYVRKTKEKAINSPGIPRDSDIFAQVLFIYALSLCFGWDGSYIGGLAAIVLIRSSTSILGEVQRVTGEEVPRLANDSIVCSYVRLGRKTRWLNSRLCKLSAAHR